MGSFVTTPRDPAKDGPTSDNSRQLTSAPAPGDGDSEQDSGVSVRATKKRSTPMNESGSSGDEASTDQILDVSEIVIEEVASSPDNPRNRAKLATEIDGKSPHQRTLRERVAVEETIEETARMLEKKTVVVVADPGQKEMIKTTRGALVETSVKPDEKSKLIKANDGTNVLVLSSDLSKKEAIIETSEFVADELLTTALAKGVRVSRGFRRGFLRGRARHVRRFYRLTVIRPRRVRDKIASMNDDPIVARHLEAQQWIRSVRANRNLDSE